MPRWIAYFVFTLALIPISLSGKPATLENLLNQARNAQRLVSTFDRKLENATNESALDRLLQSELYCHLQNARSENEIFERDLLDAARFQFRNKRENELAEELESFAKKDAAAGAAVGQIVIQLSFHENELCGAVGCLMEHLKIRLPFTPGEDSFADFLFQKRGEISVRDARHDRPGKCFGMSPQASYDWKNRNWISSGVEEGEFVVTYDDGPHSTHTAKIQESWNNTNMAKPAFFWAAENVVKMPELVRSTHLAGFPVACHSERHPDLGNLAKASGAANLSKINKEIFGEELKQVTDFAAWKIQTLDREILGAARTITETVRAIDPAFSVRHFRLPFGSGVSNDLIGARFQAANFDHFLWRVDSLDWQDKNPASVMKRVTTQMRAGKKGLILFHDIQAPTVETTKLLIQAFQNTPGWKAVSIRKMVP